MILPVIRIEKTKNYTVMSNFHLRDKNLSNKAVGLMCKMLSLPEDWDYTINGLSAICKDGRDGIASQIKELERAGYLRREQSRACGKFGDIEYILTEKPFTGNPQGNDVSKRGDGTFDAEKPFTEKPFTGKPITGNPTQLNTKESSKEKNNKSNTKCSPEFNEALNAFAEHRKKLKKPMTDYAKKLLLSKLKKLGRTEEEQIAILNQSIENGWQGIFALKHDGSGKTEVKAKPMGNGVYKVSSFSGGEEVWKPTKVIRYE
jgi:hypothetical protein